MYQHQAQYGYEIYGNYCTELQVILFTKSKLKSKQVFQYLQY